MGATYSVLHKALIPVGHDCAVVRGATEQSETAYICKPLKYKYGKQWGIHDFLYMPNSPESLLGRYFLEKLQVTITFKNGEIFLEVNDQKYMEVLTLMLTAIEVEEEISEEIMTQVFPGVWAFNLL